jgi:hypothetical protein
MKRSRLTVRQWFGWFGFALVALIVVAVAVWRGDIQRAGLDPQVPFQTYDPPPAPDYGRPSSWALLDARTQPAGAAAVFFVHPTTFDGGRDWNEPIGDARSDAFLDRVVLPNYAGPFARSGPISAPRYRQASLYTRTTGRRDAVDARAFPYRDVAAAFDVWLARNPSGPIVVAGVEQGAELAVRLVQDRISGRPELQKRLVAVYLIDALIALEELPADIPPCARRDEAGCVVGWSPLAEGDDRRRARVERRALMWNARGRLVPLGDRPVLCVNPITGSDDGAPSLIHLHRGATNATGLEWGARPAFIARMLTAQCRDGFLWHDRPTLESFRRTGGWAEQQKVVPYSLFYSDIEVDAAARLAEWTRAQGQAKRG